MGPERSNHAGVQRIGCSTSAVGTDRRQSIPARFTRRRRLDRLTLIEGGAPRLRHDDHIVGRNSRSGPGPRGAGANTLSCGSNMLPWQLMASGPAISRTCTGVMVKGAGSPRSCASVLCLANSRSRSSRAAQIAAGSLGDNRNSQALQSSPRASSIATFKASTSPFSSDTVTTAPMPARLTCTQETPLPS